MGKETLFPSLPPPLLSLGPASPLWRPIWRAPLLTRPLAPPPLLGQLAG
jgi:hypothetical protein